MFNKIIKVIICLNCISVFCQSETDRMLRFSKIEMSVLKLFHEDRPIGTGFVIDGYNIVTNFHVLESIIKAKKNNEKVNDTVWYQTALISKVSNLIPVEVKNMAFILEDFIINDTIYNYAKYTDLAIIKPPEPTNLNPTLPISNLPLYPGQEILAAGFPLSKDFMTISKGIVGNITFEYKMPANIRKMLPFAGVSIGQSDFIAAPGSSGGPVIKLGDSKEKDSIIGIVRGGFLSEAQNIKILYSKYEAKFDSIVDEDGQINYKNTEHLNIVEKYITYSNLINSNVQIPIFINASHLRQLLELLNISE